MNYNATEVLLRSLDNNHLPHGILLYGPGLAALHDACAPIAMRLLGVNEPGQLSAHPDFHTLRPSNKMRRIGVDETRSLIRQIQQTPKMSARKVVVVYDADRWQNEAANAFLKTLEEPPADCTIFLLTPKPTRLLDTIRSRCLSFHVPPGTAEQPDAAWAAWLEALDAWLADLTVPIKANRMRVASLVFSLYGLASRFEKLLVQATAVQWASLKPTLPEDIEEDQKTALETGVLKNIRAQRYAEMADQLCSVCARRPDAVNVRALHRSLVELERTAGLLEVNLKDEAAIEYVLLRWLRAWSMGR